MSRLLQIPNAQLQRYSKISWLLRKDSLREALYNYLYCCMPNPTKHRSNLLLAAYHLDRRLSLSAVSCGMIKSILLPIKRMNKVKFSKVKYFYIEFMNFDLYRAYHLVTQMLSRVQTINLSASRRTTQYMVCILSHIYLMLLYFESIVYLRFL